MILLPLRVFKVIDDILVQDASCHLLLADVVGRDDQLVRNQHKRRLTVADVHGRIQTPDSSLFVASSLNISHPSVETHPRLQSLQIRIFISLR